MCLFQLAGSGIEIFVFVFFYDSSKVYITRVVVNFTSPSAEDVVFVKFDDGATIAWFDHYTGWGDGPSFCTRHNCLLYFALEVNDVTEEYFYV